MKTKKILNICLIVAAFFLYLVASQFVELVFDWLNLAVNRDYWLTIPEFIAVGIAVLSFLLVLKSKAAVDFFSEAITELSKVTYPTKKEAGQSAVVVVVMVGIATVFLAVFDSVWSYLTQMILAN